MADEEEGERERKREEEFRFITHKSQYRVICPFVSEPQKRYHSRYLAHRFWSIYTYCERCTNVYVHYPGKDPDTRNRIYDQRKGTRDDHTQFTDERQNSADHPE
jgi:hypothetical protein